MENKRPYRDRPSLLWIEFDRNYEYGDSNQNQNKQAEPEVVESLHDVSQNVIDFRNI